MMESLRVWLMQEPPYVRIPRGSSPVAGIGVRVDCRGQVGFFVPADRFKIISFSIIPGGIHTSDSQGQDRMAHADETEERGLRNRTYEASVNTVHHLAPITSVRRAIVSG